MREKGEPMKFAIMSLTDYRLLDGNQEKPICFPTYDDAEMFIEVYRLTQVAVVPVEEE